MSDETNTQNTESSAEGATQETKSAESSSTWTVEDLQKELTKVRQEAGNYRIQAKTAAEEAAKAATQELTNKLAVALGIKEDAAAGPAALTASLTAAQVKAQQSERKLAIFQAASTTGADPNRLLDSNSFMSSVSGLDPADGSAISAAITAAIAANPILKVAQVAAASGTELGGSQEPGQITEQQLAAMSPEQVAKALKAGKLQHLLT